MVLGHVHVFDSVDASVIILTWTSACLRDVAIGGVGGQSASG